MTSTDYLRLSEHKIFKELCESLPKNITKAQNLLTVRDSVLFTWDFQNNYVMCLNVKAARSRDGDNVIHQAFTKWKSKVKGKAQDIICGMKKTGGGGSLPPLTAIEERLMSIVGWKGVKGDNTTELGLKLLPLRPPLFTPEFLVANETGTLLAVAGPGGVLVLQLPMRYPPYGAFENNKEVVYCRSHSLDERLLSCSETVEVRQVKFHPGSINDNHILVLTSDNMLRLYQVENNEAHNISTFSIGEKPVGIFPGSKTPFLDIYGEIAVDFDFGQPEISNVAMIYDFEDTNKVAYRKFYRAIEEKSRVNVQTQTTEKESAKREKIVPKDSPGKNKEQSKKKWSNLVWPVYILRGNSTVYSINIDLNKKSKAVLKGPLPMSSFNMDQSEACSLICLNSTPQMLCIGLSNGTLCHSILLDIEEYTYNKMKESAKTVSEVPTKEITIFETIELELGLTTSDDDFETKYKCPIFLQNDESRVGRYFATHSAGVHSITIFCVEELQNYVNGPEDIDPTSDIFNRPSSAEYLVCTKTASSEKVNPVIGFSLYYEPTSIITLLGDGSLVTLGILYAAILPKTEDLAITSSEEINSPLNKMLKEPFDQYIQKILKKASTQPVLKLSSSANQSQEQCYELLQRAAQVFREDYFKHHTKAREEMEKRIQTLHMLKKNQQREIERMDKERDILQEKASNLAEKYEDIKDKQDELLKKCETLLMLVSRKKCEPSDAEKAFKDELKISAEKSAAYGRVIDKIKNKMKYQQVQMENWRAQEVKKVATISDSQSNTIKTILQESTKKITEMTKEVNEYKMLLSIK